MASTGFDGVSFTVYTMEDELRRVHGFHAELEVMIDLQPNGSVSLARQTDAIRPSSATKADVKHVLAAAAQHFDELVALWETQHG